MRLHPAARLLGLVCLAVLASRLGRLGALACCAAPALWAVTDPPPRHGSGLLRLRWLLITISTLYAWLTVGTPVFPGQTVWVPPLVPRLPRLHHWQWLMHRVSPGYLIWLDAWPAAGGVGYIPAKPATRF